MANQKNPAISARDELLRDSFTAAESLVFWCILIAASVASWGAGPRSFWVLGFFIIFGVFSIFILKVHERHHPFFVDMLWPRFWLLSLPAIWLGVQMLVGFIQDPVESLVVGDQAYLELSRPNAWLPVMAADGVSFITMAGLCAIYLFTCCLFLVPKSQYFFARLLPMLCLSAVLICIFGLLQQAARVDAPVLTKGTGASDFFAFFPYDGHWAAFATLWCAVCIGLTLQEPRYQDHNGFVSSLAPWFLTGAIFLGASAAYVEAKWPAVFLFLTLGIGLGFVSAHYLRNVGEIHRWKLVFSCGIGCLSFVVIGLRRSFELSPFQEKTEASRRAAWEMFEQSPLFGWGIDAFAVLVPFFLDDRLQGERFDRAHSDIVQYLAEFGLIGCLVFIGILSYLVLRCFLKSGSSSLTNQLLVGCSMVLMLAFVDTPFMSPAVFFSFFVVFFSGLRWADLSRTNVDEVDAKLVNLVANPGERRVPFHRAPEKEIYK